MKGALHLLVVITAREPIVSGYVGVEWLENQYVCVCTVHLCEYLDPGC